MHNLGGFMAKDLAEAIKRARSVRSRFLIDDPTTIVQDTKAMIDVLWPIQSAQTDSSQKLHSHIYRIDRRKPFPDEWRKRRDSAIIAKLSLLQWGYRNNSGKSTDQLIDELDDDLVKMTMDGITPYERYIRLRTEPRFSNETARHYRNLTPKIRAQLWQHGLTAKQPIKRTKGRPRINPPTKHSMLRTTPVVLSRERWRIGEIYIACKALHQLVRAIEKTEKNASEWNETGKAPYDPEIAVFCHRYRLDELYQSKTKYVPDRLPERLAIAIVSADYQEPDYHPNDKIAMGAFALYGLFLKTDSKHSLAVKLQGQLHLNKYMNLLDE